MKNEVRIFIEYTFFKVQDHRDLVSCLTMAMCLSADMMNLSQGFIAEGCRTNMSESIL